MKNLIVIAIIALFLGVAVAPSINADVKEHKIVEQEIVEDKFDKLIGLVEWIISYYERTYGTSDCECEEPTPWPFPALCTLLVIPYIIFGPINLIFGLLFGIPIFGDLVTSILDIAASLNCYWQ